MSSVVVQCLKLIELLFRPVIEEVIRIGTNKNIFKFSKNIKGKNVCNSIQYTVDSMTFPMWTS